MQRAGDGEVPSPHLVQIICAHVLCTGAFFSPVSAGVRQGPGPPPPVAPPGCAAALRRRHRDHPGGPAGHQLGRDELPPAPARLGGARRRLRHRPGQGARMERRERGPFVADGRAGRRRRGGVPRLDRARLCEALRHQGRAVARRRALVATRVGRAPRARRPRHARDEGAAGGHADRGGGGAGALPTGRAGQPTGQAGRGLHLRLSRRPGQPPAEPGGELRADGSR